MAGLIAKAPETAAIIEAVRRLAAIHTAMETALFAAKPQILAAHGAYRRRAPLLDADCHALGAGPMPATQLADVPQFTGNAAWAGWLYVAEGSALGGAVIGRHLAAHRPDLPTLRGFDPYGPKRGAIWRRFGNLLERHLVTAEAQREAVSAACRGFTFVLQRMSRPTA